MRIGKPNRTFLVAAALLCASAAAIAATIAKPEPLVVDAASLSIDPSRGVRIHDGRPFTGIAEKRNPGGSLAESDSFVDGLRDGHSRVWFVDGTLAYETYFERGLRQGTSRTWWSNGNLRSETKFVADRQEGEARAWYITGEKYQRHFYAGGIPTGLQRAWRKNGELYENFEIRNGRSYGMRNSKICVEVTEAAT